MTRHADRLAAITAWTAANEAARHAYADRLDRLPCGRCGRRDTDTHTCNEGERA